MKMPNTDILSVLYQRVSIWCCNPHSTYDSIWESVSPCTKLKTRGRLNEENWTYVTNVPFVRFPTPTKNGNRPNEYTGLSMCTREHLHSSLLGESKFRSSEPKNKNCTSALYSFRNKYAFKSFILVQSRQRAGVCPYLLHSSLCAPQTDCWAHPCTAGGGRQAPQPWASRSSPPWLAGRLQRGEKVQEDNTRTVSVLYDFM